MMDKILGKYTIKDASRLVVDSYRNVSTDPKYTAEERREGARELLADLAQDYRRNKIQIFEIIEQSLAEILPERINNTIGKFAEIQQFKAGNKPTFKVSNGEIKVYNVSLGGTVQRHRKTHDFITIETEAIQGKVYEEMSRVRAGLVDFNELIDELLEKIEDALYDKIYAALIDTYGTLPDANKVSDTSIDEKELDRLIQIVGSYGNPIIMGTRMGLAELPEIKSDEADSDIYNRGIYGKYKGVQVMEIKNVVADTSNSKFKLEDRYIYIIPEGKEKIVKVAIEDKAYVRDSEGEDWTVNFETVVQNGVAVLQTHHIGIVDVTSLATE